ncbi:hypothetical protein H2199_007293 [Coniosporium tulheliwenetii]|uniref:Uncharacterized protein n=1 Tax=Coniosporium tulheliwenetii TaxID=3383036 RepID=A0ACC2YQX9_9PEZI|nr:hypothetical protein H2199_007293 [Cladosporium sp. JES 115]
MDQLEATRMASTPSPAPSAGTTHSSASRRPPRKSTLTQQQKNQKRQRATQDQLVTLEMEFSKNPTPTAVVREKIAQEINMTERSVQIWFQNRRAKIKNTVKKSIESGEDCNDIPESMRRYLALQAMESGKSLGRDLLGRSGGGMTPYGSGSMLFNGETSSAKVVIHHFACRSLSVGSWRRVGQSAMDLVIFYSPEKCCITYYINNDSAGYKIEYPFSYIKNITLDNGDVLSNAEGAAQRPGGLIVELNRPPNFFMDSSGSGGFYQCGDFTEDQQASQVLVHHLGGHPKVLSTQLAKLVTLDSFQNRHSAFDPNTLAVSAPVSPIHIPRPASQPNHVTHPQHFGMPPPEHPFSFGLQPRGHKRQRSRSVPVAIDFSMFRQQPMPSFLIQHQEHSPYIPNPEIFAPIPQAPHDGTNGPNPQRRHLRRLRHGLPAVPHVSHDGQLAALGIRYASLLHLGSSAREHARRQLRHPFNMPFLSPPMIDPSSVMAPSVSPLSHMSHHGDPVIADQSPPMTSIGRSASADLYRMSHDPTMGEDALSLGDFYSKQSFSLPFRDPPGPGEEVIDEFDMSNLVSFGTIDPSSLSPETVYHSGAST